MILSTIFLASFVFVEHNIVEFPLVPVRVMWSSAIGLLLLLQSSFYAFVFTSMQLLIPSYFTVTESIPITTAVLMSSSMALPLFVTSFISGRLTNSFGYKKVLSAGFSYWNYALISPAVMFGKDSLFCDGVVLLCIGASVGLILLPSVTGVQAQALKADRAVSVATRNVLELVEGSFGCHICCVFLLLEDGHRQEHIEIITEDTSVYETERSNSIAPDSQH